MGEELCDVPFLSFASKPSFGLSLQCVRACKGIISNVGIFGQRCHIQGFGPETSHPGAGGSAAMHPQATDGFCNLHTALKDMHASAKVTVEWYFLEETERAVAKFNVGEVELTPAPDAPKASVIWPPRRRAAPMHPPRPMSLAEPLAADPVEAGSSPPAVEDIGMEDNEASPDEEDDDLEDDGEEDGDLAEMLAEVLDGAERSAAEESIAAPAPQGGAANAEGNEAAGSAEGAAEAVAPPIGMAAGPQRKGAIVTMHVIGGSISYYPSKNSFEAVCDNRDHGRCVLTRTRRGKPNPAGGAPLGGRPVGFLAAWLGAGPGAPSKAEHWAQSALDRPLAERQRLRSDMATMGSGRTLLDNERPAEEGEPAEPEDLRPYIGGAR